MKKKYNARRTKLYQLQSFEKGKRCMYKQEVTIKKKKSMCSRRDSWQLENIIIE